MHPTSAQRRCVSSGSRHAVPGSPVTKGGGSRLEVRETLPAPELLLIDPMAPLDFAVLLRPAGPNVPVPDPGGFDPEDKGEGELLPVIALQPLDGEREGPPELGEDGVGRALMQTPVEPQDAKARAVVQGRVLKRPAARDLHVLHVDLNRLSRFRLLEESHLARFPLAGPPQAGQAHVAKHRLNRAHGQPHPVHALEPKPCASRPVTKLLAGLADQLYGLEQTRWNRIQAAKLLGISYRALLYKIKEAEFDRQSASNPRPGRDP
jgi:hypothetical protein